MRIYDVQVNHLENPLGFRMDNIRFNWKVTQARGTRQQCARAVVAADPALETVLLDTGWREDASSLAFPVELIPEPRKRYYYRIFVRSEEGEEAASEICWFETGLEETAWQAQWITCDNSQPRHPFFEKEITPKQPPVSARLYVCGLGLYEAYYNDRRLGDEYLTPYSNNYHRWIQYQTFDVTDALQQPGKLSILLGNGWYKARFGFDCFEDKGIYGDEWKLIAQLHLSYPDGSQEIIATDDTWQVRRSNITFSNLYDGEHRDDTLPPLPPEPARLCLAPEGRLTHRMSTPVTIRETFSPVRLIRTPKDELVLDLGQEITGSFRLKVDLPRGSRVRIQTGEILQGGCFYNENLRSAKSEYLYTSAGEPVMLQPHFTYYGYRYVKIEGMDHLRPEDFTGLAMYSHIPLRGTLRTGHPLVNQLLSNIRWGMKGNFLDVPTDCPQRDERMGWTGDAQVFSATATYLHDTYSFYAKYLYDMDQEQRMAQGRVPDTVPAAGLTSCACVWGDAACIIPWNLYLFYGDRQILRDQLPSMKAWVDHITYLDGEDHAWGKRFHYGDWLALDNPTGDTESALGGTDVGYIANIYYAASAELVAKAAAVLGDAETEGAYRTLAGKQFAHVRREYFSSTGRPCITTQTGLLLALKYDLSENRALVKTMLQEQFRWSGGKLKTGFVGTPLLCPVLTDNGMEELAWKLLLNEEYPGWLREVKLGATTIWERWNSVLDDGTLSGTGMNSLNHYAYGSIGQWLYSHAAGLAVSQEHPGCTHMDIRPLLSGELGSLEASFDSPGGRYCSSWRFLDSRHVQLSVTVPFGCTATLVLPHCPDSGVISLTPGDHTYTYETDRDFRGGFTLDSTLRQLQEDRVLWEKFCALVPAAQIPEEYWDQSLGLLLDLFGRHLDPQLTENAAALLQQLQNNP